MSSLGLLPGCAWPQVTAAGWRDLLTQLATWTEAAGHVWPEFTMAVIEREERYPTGLPTPIPTAIPHADPGHVIHAGVSVATLARPVAFGEMGGSGEQLPVRAVVMLCMTDGKTQMDALHAVLTRLTDENAVAELLAAGQRPDFDRFVAGWLAAN